MNGSNIPGERFTSLSEEETKEIAQKIVEKFKGNRIFTICLKGNLGSGKTVFVKGFAKALGVDDKVVKSPTYTYFRKYKTEECFVYHFDYYRLEKADHLVLQELDEVMQQKVYVLIEWPEKIEHIVPKPYIEIRFEAGENPHERFISIQYK